MFDKLWSYKVKIKKLYFTVPLPTITTPVPNSQVANAMAQIQPNAKPNSYLKPLPEETDYFDPKFIEYHENNSKTLPQNKSSIPADVLAHYIPGDTPTLYAGTKSKNNSTKPIANPNQGSAFTFFGMPIPSLNLNNFWNSGKSLDKHKKDSRREPWPPSEPEIQKDGFIPLLPGEGGFVPMNITTPKNHTVHTHHVSGHATISKVTLPTSTQRNDPINAEEFFDNEPPLRTNRNVSHRDSLLEINSKNNFVPISNINDTRAETENRRYSTTELPKTTFISEPVFSSEVHDDSVFSDRIADTITMKPGIVEIAVSLF